MRTRMTFSMLRRVLRALVLAGLSLALAACGSDHAASGSGAGSFHVVATTTQVADFARNVAGSRASVTQILAPNTDPHEYEGRPGDVKALSEGELVLRSGGEVDAGLGDALTAAGVDSGIVVDVGKIAGLEGDDPHWWQDLVRVETGVAAIRDTLVKDELGGATTYRANASRYLARRKTLDASGRKCLDQVPANQRLLVPSHDAL